LRWRNCCGSPASCSGAWRPTGSRNGGTRSRKPEHWEKVPISAQRLVRELRTVLPRDGTVVMEATTTHPYFRRLFDVPSPDTFFYETGGSLGWGVPAAMGIKLATPGRPVVAVVGDGSFMYYPQALWTGVKYGIPVVTIVCNNRSYLNDKMHLVHRKGPAHERGDYRTVDITDPDLDYVKCAEAVGAYRVRVERPADLGPALRAALAGERPAVLDVVIDPWQSGGKIV
jgi:benzoylformate decarboxylase